MYLQREQQYFDSMRNELVHHFGGRYALVIGEELLDVFDHPTQAYKEGFEKRGDVEMLIKRISREEYR